MRSFITSNQCSDGQYSSAAINVIAIFDIVPLFLLLCSPTSVLFSMIFNFCRREGIHNTNPQILHAIRFCFVLDFF